MPKVNRVLSSAIALCAMLVSSHALHADIPGQISYQGSLQSGGQPVNGNKAFSFSFFSTASGGTALWSESHATVAVTAGVFGVQLGSITPFPQGLFSNPNLWIETTVDAETLSPRLALASTPYAFRAAVADSVVSGGPGQWQTSAGNVYRLAGNVGIGTSTPSTPLDVIGTAKATTFRADVLPSQYGLYEAGYVELHAPTPFIDFHFNNDANDYNTRIINNANRSLYVDANILEVVGVTKSLGGFRFADGTTQTTAQVQGPQGPAGPQGPQGEPGPPGGGWVFNGDDIYSGNTGNVGVGVTTPASKLHINGSLRAGSFLDADNTIYFLNPSQSTVSAALSGSVGIGTTSPQDPLEVVGNIRADQITDRQNVAYFVNPASTTTAAALNGNVGIGTTTPTQKLDVAGTVLADALQDKQNTAYFVDPGNNGTAAVLNGNVGIDVTNPSQKLTVSGNIAAMGEFQVLTAGGGLRIAQGINTDLAGSATYRSSGGKPNVLIGTANNQTGLGVVTIVDSQTGTVTKATMYCNASNLGVVEANIINTLFTAQEDPNTEIVYSSPATDQPAVYVAGTSQLRDGKAVVELPAHFVKQVDWATLTIQLTPLSADSRGLAAVEKQPGGRIVVQEIAKGAGSYGFDYRAEGRRKGFESFKVVRPVSESRAAASGDDGIQTSQK